jgi:capsular exopolysaccharide synthesis family protein
MQSNILRVVSIKLKKMFGNKEPEERKERNTILDTEVPFIVTEAYNSLRTNISFALATQKSNVFLVSSPVSGDGKSTTAANIGISMAQAGSTVVLIDADMRRCTQHRMFKIKNDKGLSTLLGGMSKFDETVNKNVYPGLDVVTAGPIPPNPSELVNSDNMADLLKELSKLYDYVIIDTAPINVVSDALVLSKLTAGLVLVAKQNSTTYDDVDRVVDNMNFAGSRILGVVINNMKDLGSKRSYKYSKSYNYNYNYSYGYKDKEKDKEK